MLGYVIPNRGDSSLKPERLKSRDISRSEISAYLLFFDQVSYFNGLYSPPAAIRFGEQWRLRLPNDSAFEDYDNPLVVPFSTIDPTETVAEAMAYQMGRGFKSQPDTSWVYHPKYLKTNAIYDNTVFVAAPSIGITFLDGISCPPEETPISEVLDFREQRASERQAFMQAMFEASENLDVAQNGTILNVPFDQLQIALTELNKTAIERWGDKVRHSFSWGIRPNEETLKYLAGAAATYEFIDNFTASLLIALSGAIEVSLDLTPRLEPHSEFTKAISYAFDVQKRFPNSEMYTRFRTKA